MVLGYRAIAATAVVVFGVRGRRGGRRRPLLNTVAILRRQHMYRFGVGLFEAITGFTGRRFTADNTRRSGTPVNRQLMALSDILLSNANFGQFFTLKVNEFELISQMFKVKKLKAKKTKYTKLKKR